jgi:peptidoglycan hydrolase-like protein with peptidoglycan-binding domain
VQSAPASRPPAQAQQDSLQSHSLIKSGSRGTEVSGLQDRLKQAGYQVGQAGAFDAKTEAAVRQYQKDNGLQVDGKVGQQTWGNMLGQKGLPPGTQMLKGGSGAPSADPTGRNKDSFEPSGSGQRPGGGQAPTQAPGGQKPGQAGGTQGPTGANPAPANGSTVDRMLNEARKHIGYHEGAGNSNKFSTAMGRPAEAWCADFVSYVAKQAGAKTVNTAAAQGIQDQLAKQGRWKGMSNPQPGDAVTFNWSGNRGARADHVGMVESVFQKNGQTYIRTIEGNSGDQVRYREYPANSRNIKGFGTIA